MAYARETMCIENGASFPDFCSCFTKQLIDTERIGNCQIGPMKYRQLWDTYRVYSQKHISIFYGFRLQCAIRTPECTLQFIFIELI